MVSNAFAVVVLALSSIELCYAIYLTRAAQKPIISNASMLTKISSNMQTNGLSECNYCHHIVARYFIDGSGATACANCKSEGFAAAQKNKSLNEK